MLYVSVSPVDDHLTTLSTHISGSKHGGYTRYLLAISKAGYLALIILSIA